MPESTPKVVMVKDYLNFTLFEVSLEERLIGVVMFSKKDNSCTVTLEFGVSLESWKDQFFLINQPYFYGFETVELAVNQLVKVYKLEKLFNGT